jgi:hypothetical protein
LGYDDRTTSKLRSRRRRGGFQSPAKGKEVVLLKKELMEAVLLKPARGGEAIVGAVYVSIGEWLLEEERRLALRLRTRGCC